MADALFDSPDAFDTPFRPSPVLTNVEVNIRVTDTQTGTVKPYVNPLGTPFAPIQDDGAFATCP